MNMLVFMSACCTGVRCDERVYSPEADILVMKRSKKIPVLPNKPLSVIPYALCLVQTK